MRIQVKKYNLPKEIFEIKRIIRLDSSIPGNIFIFQRMIQNRKNKKEKTLKRTKVYPMLIRDKKGINYRNNAIGNFNSELRVEFTKK